MVILKCSYVIIVPEQTERFWLMVLTDNYRLLSMLASEFNFLVKLLAFIYVRPPLINLQQIIRVHKYFQDGNINISWWPIMRTLRLLPIVLA